MSHLSESFITSPFFLAEPISVHHNPHSNTSYNNQQSFLIKGEETPITYNGNNNYNEDILVVNSQGGSFQLNRKTLKESLQELKTQSHVSLRELSTEYTESFRSIVEALRLLHGSQGLYDIILNDIRNVFNDIKDVKPGTVAAFFIGCFNDDKFPGPMGCSPKCAASLPPTEGTPGYNNCEDLVLIYSDGLFSSLNEKQSTHAYIYIGDPEFSGFTLENISQLKSAGIEKSSLIYGNQDGTYREVTGDLTIDQLPQKPQSLTSKSTIDTKSLSEYQADDNGSNSSGAGIVFAIVIIVIIILFLVVLYRSYNPNWY